MLLISIPNPLDAMVWALREFTPVLPHAEQVCGIGGAFLIRATLPHSFAERVQSSCAM